MNQTHTRILHDSMGAVEVPQNALYGAQTQRAVENFPISGLIMPRAFIRALGLIKEACAAANAQLQLLDSARATRIQQVAREVAAGKYDDQFPIDVFQTGSGTSSNMNANEVIATLASQADLVVHPNDHVNMSQSSNDTIPTAIQLSAVLMIEAQLFPAMEQLITVITRRAATLQSVVKTGRTHLMDAMPVTLGQELQAWADQLIDARARIKDTLPRLCRLPQGGTAVGSGINAPEDFGARVCRLLSERCTIALTPLINPFVGIAAQDGAVEISGQLRALAVTLTKIANDLRWMNSGPLAGLGEISLPALQPGSSIMPGKVNPVIPEAVAMCAAQVQGNDVTIAIAGQSGNFQLNVMLPLIAYNLLQSITLLSNGQRLLADKAIAGFTVNSARLQEVLGRNPVLITALNRKIGYEKGAVIAKRAYREQRPVLEVAAEETDIPLEALRKLLDPAQLV